MESNEEKARREAAVAAFKSQGRTVTKLTPGNARGSVARAAAFTLEATELECGKRYFGKPSKRQ